MAHSSEVVKKGRADAREAILKAGHEEFSLYGFSGARVDRIARRSGFNKQLLYYYFNGKADLYLRVIEADYLGLRGHGQDLDLASLSPDAAITRLVDFLLTMVAQSRSSMRLLFDVNDQDVARLQQSAPLPGSDPPILATIAEVLARGEAGGQFRKGVDPVNLFLSIAGMAFFFLSGSMPLSTLCGRDLTSEPAILAYRDHVVTLVLAGLRGVPSTV